jgi:hypothetical protein
MWPEAVVQRPLVLLAHGDSWFDYRLSGDDLSLEPTDVIAKLSKMAAQPPLILNISPLRRGDDR